MSRSLFSGTSLMFNAVNADYLMFCMEYITFVVQETIVINVFGCGHNVVISFYQVPIHSLVLLMLSCFLCGFLAIVTGDTSDEVYASVKDVITEQAGPMVWIPSTDSL